jgi:hypothetical protein
MQNIDKRVVLSKAELEFLQDLKKGDISKYKPVYVRTLKHRILRKHKQLTHEALLLSEVLDKLQDL